MTSIIDWFFVCLLACCHRARKWALYMFFVSILCAAAAIALIVLDGFFIGDVSRCFFSKVNCDELISSYPRLFSQPLGRKVQVLKAQLACAALMLATAILYMLLFISTSMATRRSATRVLIEHHQLPAQLVRQTGRVSPQPRKTTSVPATYDPSQFECPHCGTAIKLTQRKWQT